MRYEFGLFPVEDLGEKVFFTAYFGSMFLMLDSLLSLLAYIIVWG